MSRRVLRLVFAAVLVAGSIGMAGPVAAADTDDAALGNLAARVQGSVRIGGSFELQGAMAEPGGIRLTGFERDCELRVETWTSRTRYPDGTIEIRGVEGRFAVRCRDIVVELRSREMRWSATGRGRAILDAGRAGYSLNDGPRTAWAVGTVVRF